MSYTTKGPVRGPCGHRHRTLRAALRCVRRDRRECAALGGGAYSDRSVVKTDGLPLTAGERDELEELEFKFPPT